MDSASTSWCRVASGSGNVPTSAAGAALDVNDDVGKACATCLQVIRTRASRIRCDWCKSPVHIACLTCPLPTSLLGDNFFSLACQRCTPAKTDVVKRDKVNWYVV